MNEIVPTAIFLIYLALLGLHLLIKPNSKGKTKRNQHHMVFGAPLLVFGVGIFITFARMPSSFMWSGDDAYTICYTYFFVISGVFLALVFLYIFVGVFGHTSMRNYYVALG